MTMRVGLAWTLMSTPGPGWMTPAHAASLRILIVVTSREVLTATGDPTGLWLAELTHPYHELVTRGFEINIASPSGGPAPIDPASLPSNPRSPDRGDPVGRAFLNARSDADKLRQTIKLSRVDPARYAAVLYVGGRGATLDFPDDPDIARIGAAIYERGGIVAAICYGSAALAAIKLSDGTWLLSGKTVTGLSEAEERSSDRKYDREDVVPFHPEADLPKRGAVYTHADRWEPHVVVSGRVVTGQNPASASALGQRLAELLRQERSTQY